MPSTTLGGPHIYLNNHKLLFSHVTAQIVFNRHCTNFRLQLTWLISISVLNTIKQSNLWWHILPRGSQIAIAIIFLIF